MLSRIKRIGLSVIALLPFGGISFAAQAYSKDIDSRLVKNSPETWDSLLALKSKLFPPLVVESDLESAFERFRSQSQQTDYREIDSEFEKAIELLRAKGLLEMNEKMIISKIPSYYGS